MSNANPVETNDIFNALTDVVGFTEELLNSLLDQVQNLNIPESIANPNLNLKLTKITEDISRFVEISTLLVKIIHRPHDSNVTQIKNSHLHLLSILKGIGLSQQNQDRLMLEDLIMHELKENLTEWKKNLMPAVTRVLPN
jgi:hypothetical protein